MHVETLTRGLTITDPADVAAYKDAFSRLRKLAVTGDDAQALLRRIALPAPSRTALSGHVVGLTPWRSAPEVIAQDRPSAELVVLAAVIEAEPAVPLPASERPVAIARSPTAR